MAFLVFKSPDIKDLGKRIKGFALAYLIDGDSLKFNHGFSRRYNSDSKVDALGGVICYTTKSRHVLIVKFPKVFKTDELIVKAFKKEYLGLIEDDYDVEDCKEFARKLQKINSIKPLKNSFNIKLLEQRYRYAGHNGWNKDELDKLSAEANKSIKLIHDYIELKKIEFEEYIKNHSDLIKLKRNF